MPHRRHGAHDRGLDGERIDIRAHRTGLLGTGHQGIDRRTQLRGRLDGLLTGRPSRVGEGLGEVLLRARRLHDMAQEAEQCRPWFSGGERIHRGVVKGPKVVGGHRVQEGSGAMAVRARPRSRRKAGGRGLSDVPARRYDSV